jgi:glycosyltransferase involved in cell wall biosynthesis
MKILVVASVLDLSLPYGCTPAWWQLLKALHENGAEVIATPYQGRPVESLWWRTYDNPCYHLGATFAALLRAARRLPRRRGAGPADGREGVGQRLQRGLVRGLVTPRWLRHLSAILEREQDVAAVLVLTAPLNHLRGIPTALRQRFGVPVVYYDGDLPASLPGFGGFRSGFSIYHGADLAEYDAVLSNSQGALDDLARLGARRTEAVWWAADPGAFRPADAAEYIDVFFYGLGTEYRADWLRDMIAVPSRALPHLRFVVAGGGLDLDLGRAERVGLLPASQLHRYVTRSRLNLNVARAAHASVYASATTRLFELAAMGRAIVTNPLAGLSEWFEPGQEVAVVAGADEAVRTYARLVADADARRAMGRAARARVLRQHTYDHRARQLLGFLRSLAGDRRPGPDGAGRPVAVGGVS